MQYWRNAILLFVSVLITLTATANAADPEHLAEYRLYMAALEKGDRAAAAVHALAAWEAAEKTLGDHETTAVLAYNYGRLLVFQDSAAALPALARADALMKAGVAKLPADELELFLAYAKFQTSKRSFKDANALRAVIEAQEARGVPPSLDSATILLNLAMDDSNGERFNDAATSAARAEAHLIAVVPNDYRSRAKAVIIGGVAVLLAGRRTRVDVIKAHKEFDRAQRLFPPQKDIASFDVVFAQALAWDSAAHSALNNLGRSKFPDECPPESDCEIQLFEVKTPTDEECAIRWEARDPPDYPRLAENKGYLGAAVVGYRLGEDKRVHDIRLLAEVPTEVFGQHSIKSMENWRLVDVPSSQPGCRENRVSNFIYTIDAR